MSDAKARFDAAVERSKSLPTPSTSVQLEMYGLFKQVSNGDVSGSRPGMFHMRGRAKWDAWEKCRGMTNDQAVDAYVALVDKLAKG